VLCAGNYNENHQQQTAAAVGEAEEKYIYFCV